MANTVDARGLSCPQPVMMTLDAIKKYGTGEIEVMVDTDTSKENVIRLAQSQGWDVVSVDPDGIGYKIKIRK